MLEPMPKMRHTTAVKKDEPHLSWFLALLLRKIATVHKPRATAGRVETRRDASERVGFVCGWFGGVARTEGGGPREDKQCRVAHAFLERGRCPIQLRLLGIRSLLGKAVAVVVRYRDYDKDDQGGRRQSNPNDLKWRALPNAKSKQAGAPDNAAVEGREVVTRYETEVEPVVEDLSKDRKGLRAAGVRNSVGISYSSRGAGIRAVRPRRSNPPTARAALQGAERACMVLTRHPYPCPSWATPPSEAAVRPTRAAG